MPGGTEVSGRGPPSPSAAVVRDRRARAARARPRLPRAVLRRGDGAAPAGGAVPAVRADHGPGRRAQGLGRVGRQGGARRPVQQDAARPVGRLRVLVRRRVRRGLGQADGRPVAARDEPAPARGRRRRPRVRAACRSPHVGAVRRRPREGRRHDPLPPVRRRLGGSRDRRRPGARGRLGLVVGVDLVGPRARRAGGDRGVRGARVAPRPEPREGRRPLRPARHRSRRPRGARRPHDRRPAEARRERARHHRRRRQVRRAGAGLRAGPVRPGGHPGVPGRARRREAEGRAGVHAAPAARRRPARDRAPGPGHADPGRHAVPGGVGHHEGAGREVRRAAPAPVPCPRGARRGRAARRRAAGADRPGARDPHRARSHLPADDARLRHR